MEQNEQTTVQIESRIHPTLGARPKGAQGKLWDQLVALTDENAKLRSAPKGKSITVRVSTKGAVSVYGLGQFPITFYQETWTRLLSDEVVGEIRAVIADNAALLSAKTDDEATRLAKFNARLQAGIVARVKEGA